MTDSLESTLGTTFPTTIQSARWRADDEPATATSISCSWATAALGDADQNSFDDPEDVTVTIDRTTDDDSVEAFKTAQSIELDSAKPVDAAFGEGSVSFTSAGTGLPNVAGMTFLLDGRLTQVAVSSTSGRDEALDHVVTIARVASKKLDRSMPTAALKEADQNICHQIQELGSEAPPLAPPLTAQWDSLGTRTCRSDTYAFGTHSPEIFPVFATLDAVRSEAPDDATITDVPARGTTGGFSACDQYSCTAATEAHDLVWIATWSQKDSPQDPQAILQIAAKLK